MATAISKDSGDPRDIFKRFDRLCHPLDPSFKSDFLRKYRPNSNEREQIMSGAIRFIDVKYLGNGSRQNEFKIEVAVGTSPDSITRREQYDIVLVRHSNRVVLLFDTAK